MARYIDNATGEMVRVLRLAAYMTLTKLTNFGIERYEGGAGSFFVVEPEAASAIYPAEDFLARFTRHPDELEAIVKAKGIILSTDVGVETEELRWACNILEGRLRGPEVVRRILFRAQVGPAREVVDD